MTSSATITVYDLDALQCKVNSLNKKAKKAGVSPITWALLDTVTVTKKKYDAWSGQEVRSYEVFDHYEVEIVAEEIVLPGGWRLVGVIDHTENLVRSVPGETAPLSAFVDRGPVCDHCNTFRQRSETFILEHEHGSRMQVGRQCLGLFLGIDPERALDMVGMASESLVFDEEWTGSPKVKGYNLEDFLAHTACMIRTAGWRSRTMAAQGSPATADMTVDNMINQELRLKDKRFGTPLWIDPTAEDIATAKEVAAWLGTLAQRSGLSDYMANLAQIGANGFCTPKSAGYAASAINAFFKEREWDIKKAAERASRLPSAHVGAVKERLRGLVLNKVSSSGKDTEWGYLLFHKMIDEQGNVFKWSTQEEMANGKYLVTGTVKRHDEYNGEKQTLLTRCDVKLIE